MPASAKPIVLLPACNRAIGQHPFHVVGKKYVDGVRLAGCTPLVVPTAEPEELAALLTLADGLLLTGSKSNVHPSHFGEAVLDPDLPLDPARDAWVLPIAVQALERGLPLLAICRGAQEVNVALGGSLHQAVQAVGPYRDHRSNGDEPAERQYAAAHPISVEPGGVLAAVIGAPTFEVNSLHGQAVNRLARGLQVEARAPDGLIEAFSVPGRGFNLSVQWHPEWRAADNPVSRRIFDAFGAACRAFHDERARRRTPPV